MEEEYNDKNIPQSLLADLPTQPGIYKYFDEENNLIYVGKAKNIKKRVSSYFQKQHLPDNKTRRLVSQIRRIEYTIVNTEFDAYLLENSLIKNHQPKYNILLKDDKTYPYLYITNERFPRILSTRKFDRTQGTFFGPYTSVKAMNTVLDLLRKLFYLRTCNYNLSEKNIEDKKFKVCLEYHIGNCKGPCEAFYGEDIYNENIRQARQVLKGNVNIVKNYFKDKMQEAAKGLEFERAQLLKNKIDLLEKFQSTSVIVNPDIKDLEVYTIQSDEKLAVINFLKVVNGAILSTKTLEVKKKLDESDQELLQLAIINIRETLEEPAEEIISNIELEFPTEEIKVAVPKIGDKKKLINLSCDNIKFYLHKILTQKTEPAEDRILLTLQKDLRLTHLPKHIECFDNSNFQGTNPVSAMVVFMDGKAAKKEYRHYNIKTVQGPNDFDSMKEVVTRRYRRLLDEEKQLPDLIIIDGGKGQLSAACEALTALGIYGKIPIIGIAKRLEEIYYPEDNDPLYIEKKSESLKLIQRIRNEAHRFGINFHRDKRSKASIDSKLTSLKGIGTKTMEKLLIKYKSIANIKNAPEEELAEMLGDKKAKFLLDQLNAES